LVAVHRHLDDPQDEFNAWFLGPKSSLLKSLSDQADEQGRKLKRQDVRQALLALGWNSYQHVANCIHASMRYVENAIGVTDEERPLFEHVFLPQPYFGGLPMILLAERADFLKTAIVKVWEDPNDQNPVAILHRLLHYYGEIAERRREADRLAKARINRLSDVRSDVPLSHRADAVPRQVRPEYSDVIDHLRELRGITCECDWQEYEVYLEAADDDDNALLKFTWRCSCGKEIGAVEMSRAELNELVREFGSPHGTKSADAQC